MSELVKGNDPASKGRPSRTQAVSDMSNTFSGDDRLVVVDLEATCDDQGAVPKQEMEIIEIGAVLVDALDYRLLADFQSFVRPIRHPRLTAFCKRLTSISQESVDAAPLFPEAVAALKGWMYGHGATVFCSWGDYDRNQIQTDCRVHRIVYPMPGRHVNLKRLFSETRGIKKRLGMGQALREVGLQLIGTHHRGIDDARNIARLLPYAVPRPTNQGPSHPAR
jgi:inhibitor of KinA sporulation pathway (predicted exonuclease)